jgi:hypothetical protein
MDAAKEPQAFTRRGSPGSKIDAYEIVQPRRAELRPHIAKGKSKTAVPKQEQKICCWVVTALHERGWIFI